MSKCENDVVTLSSGEEVIRYLITNLQSFVFAIAKEDMKPDPDEKLMMEKMGFANFTAKWQTELEEKEVEVKEERPTFR